MISFYIYVFIIKFIIITADVKEFNSIEGSVFFQRYHRYDHVRNIAILRQKNQCRKLNILLKTQWLTRRVRIVGVIISYLRQLHKKFPEKVTLISFGASHYNRDLMALKISANKYDRDRPTIMIEAGIHAREWIAPAVALGIIHQLLENKHSHMIKTVDWIIIPVLNPDGYEYSHTYDRFWRKNLYDGGECNGVDLNRNFDFHWRGKGAGIGECSVTYAGPKPFSEPESQAIANLALKYKKNIKLYVSLHSYGQKIMYPWSYENKPVNANFETEHKKLGILVSEAISTLRKTKYDVGRLSSVLYLASGTSIDWMASVANIPLCFVIEINSEKYQFSAPAREILPKAKEIFAGFKIFHKYVDKN